MASLILPKRFTKQPQGKVRIRGDIPPPTYYLIATNNPGVFYDAVNGTTIDVSNTTTIENSSGIGMSVNANISSVLHTSPSSDVDIAPISVIYQVDYYAQTGGDYATLTPTNNTFYPSRLTSSSLGLRHLIGGGNVHTADVMTTTPGVTTVAARVTDLAGQRAFCHGELKQDRNLVTYWATTTEAFFYRSISSSPMPINLLAFWHNTDIGDELCERASSNPWSLLEPEKSVFYFDVSAGPVVIIGDIGQSQATGKDSAVNITSTINASKTTTNAVGLNSSVNITSTVTGTIAAGNASGKDSVISNNVVIHAGKTSASAWAWPVLQLYQHVSIFPSVGGADANGKPATFSSLNSISATKASGDADGAIATIDASNQILTTKAVAQATASASNVANDVIISSPPATIDYIRPNGDYITGTWNPSSGATLWEMLDEVSPNDTDYIEGASTSCQVTLSDITDPGFNTGHRIKTRMSCPTGGGWMSIALKHGINEDIASTNWIGTIGPDWADYIFDIPAESIAKITDYSSLRIQFWTIVSGPVRVSHSELSITDLRESYGVAIAPETKAIVNDQTRITATKAIAVGNGKQSVVVNPSTINASKTTANAVGLNSSVTNGQSVSGTLANSTATGLLSNIDASSQLIATIGHSASSGKTAGVYTHISVNTTKGSAVSTGLLGFVANDGAIHASLAIATSQGGQANVSNINNISATVGSSNASGHHAGIYQHIVIGTTRAAATVQGLISNVGNTTFVSGQIGSGVADGISVDISNNIKIDSLKASATSSGKDSLILNGQTIHTSLASGNASGKESSISSTAFVFATKGTSSGNGFSVDIFKNISINALVADGYSTGHDSFIVNDYEAPYTLFIPPVYVATIPIVTEIQTTRNETVVAKTTNVITINN